MMTYKKQISTLAMAVAMTLAMVSEANAVTFPFTGVKVTPPQDVIAANLDEITPQNTVTVVHNITQVTPTLTASQMPNPTSASFGVVTAFKDPNMSQKVPDCAPPPTPPSNCNNIGQCGSPGNVSWSGWDKVSGGVCNTGGAGGWMVTAAGAAPANYYPPPVTTTSTMTVNTNLGNITYTAYSNGTLVVTGNSGSHTLQGTVSNGTVTAFSSKTGNTISANANGVSVAYGAGGVQTYSNGTSNLSCGSSGCNSGGSNFQVNSVSGSSGLNNW
jgi:hypothetical protein